MKKLIAILSVLLLVTIAASVSADRNQIWNVTALDRKIVAPSSTGDSQAYDLGQYKPTGFFSLQYSIASTGRVKFEYQLSNDGQRFIEPTTGSVIATGITIRSGPGSDGKDLVYFAPEPARFMRIRATELGGVSAASVTTVLFIQ